MNIKKLTTFLIFFTIWAAALFYIVFHIKSIDTNIYSLISIENDSILSSMNENLSSSVIFFFDNISSIDTVEKYNKKYSVFKSINTGIASKYDIFISDINDLKIASFKRSSLDDINEDSSSFFSSHIDALFNSFIIKMLPLEQDFFMLANHSALLENGGKFNYDIENDILYTEYNNTIYYMVQAELKESYNPSLLLELVSNIKADLGSGAVISGGALFNADGHKNGIRESIYMTILSILLSAFILLTAFRQKSILLLMTTIVFSLTMGLAGCILLFGQIHILSIIVSASLIGLVVDFSLHWLSNNQNKILKSSSIKLVVKYLLINFIITAFGYLLFMFSFMLLLQQIAVISIITLLASLLYTIFFIPHILEGSYYSTGKVFNKVFEKYIYSIQYLQCHKKVVLIIMIIITAVGGIKFILTSSFEDNIKNYSSINKTFLDDTILAGDISGMKNPSNYIVIDNYSLDKEYSLTQELIKNNLIKEYNGLSSIFLSISEQDTLKNIFKSAADNNSIVNMYISAGLDIAFIKNEFNSITSIPSMNINDILNKQAAAPYKYLYDNNSGLLFFESDFSYKELVANNKFNQILSANNSEYYNLVEMINSYFSIVKSHAVLLKLLGIIAGFIALAFVFSIKKSFNITFAVVLSLLFSIAIFSIFSIDVNIFAVFGFILAGAVGIDYAVLMLNNDIDIKNRYFGVFTSAVTSMVSFVILMSSSTYAVFTFGLSVALSLFIFIYTIPLFGISDENKKSGY